jgi:hypothetical protein
MLRGKATDPRRTSITRSSLREMVRDAYFCEDLQDCVSDITFATTSLLELLNATQPKPDLDYFSAESRLICLDATKNSTRLYTRLDSNLRMFQLLRSFSESQNVQILGLLASVFLPLPLASGLLSMQTRVADLHLLLHGFFWRCCLSWHYCTHDRHYFASLCSTRRAVEEI